jgi:hypothetical protein
MRRWFIPAFTLTAAALYWLAVAQYHTATLEQQEDHHEIVLTGPLQPLLYGGDRFLAANIESIRAAASTTTTEAQNFSLRAHLEVSRLNPCHEDNYWIGNASLSWGGSPEQGTDLLRNAMHCRYWDEWPAFFYGFNQHYFLHNNAEARQALELAAQRSANNAAAFRTFSTMLAAGEIDDTRLALEMLQRERDKAKDPALRGMLDKRVGRLKGLLILREAQAEYENRFKQPLQYPEELLKSGLLETFPEDPLKLGYEFRDQTFHLHKLKTQ